MLVKKEKKIFVYNLQYYQFEQDYWKNGTSFIRQKFNMKLLLNI